ncbi:MAG: Lrp/AsnC family transcriptional regulator [Desulfurococcales archaeon]|nr:Lrp/AsnC family transcriptional regulator [Desulfurococcales archaeon]
MVDEKDMKIIEKLEKNARVSFSEIAKELGISDVAVMKRIRKLEQDGVIRKYTIKINHKKLGYNMVSLTGFEVEPEYLFDVLKKVAAMEPVKFLALTSGDHSVMAEIWARNQEELAKIHEEIASLPGVHKVRPAIILDIIKG